MGGGACFSSYYTIKAGLTQALGWADLALLPSTDPKEAGVWRLVVAASPALDASGQECLPIQLCNLILLVLLTAKFLPLIHLF